MKYDVIVIGAGLSGLSAASLLAKRGLSVAVVEQSDTPGGSCGIFKRENAIFDQGAAMLYGFGEHGFNAHRFLFNCLEEPIHMVRHELLYTVNYAGKKIHFWPNIDRFIQELALVFPTQTPNIKRFYKDMQKMYTHVMNETPSYTTPDETNPKEALKALLKHPLSYLKFLSYMNMSAEKLLKKYFNDPEIFSFFDKLTSTYCYATVAEAPAIMASVMFIDNHEGGSYYPAGSTLFLPGKLEKVIEEHHGQMIYCRKAIKILFDQQKPVGVLLDDDTRLTANDIIYSGTVWNLYDKLLVDGGLTDEEKVWAGAQVPTYPSVILYALVDKAVIPDDTSPIEMLVANPHEIDETEVTVYLLSIDDRTICPKDKHTIVAIGPSFAMWDMEDPLAYQAQKEQEITRLIGILNQRFSGFGDAITFCELATPKTIERYTLKNNGAVAGPKQMLGQHMFRRQSIKTKWNHLYCCGESTTMGTGTPTVTTSGIAAANAVLKENGKEPFVWSPNMTNYVEVLSPPVMDGWIEHYYPPLESDIMRIAMNCEFCTLPSCCPTQILNISGIMRRCACGNFSGAKKLMDESTPAALTPEAITSYQTNCIRGTRYNTPVAISRVLDYLSQF